MEIKDIIAKINSEAWEHTPDLCDKIVENAQLSGKLKTAPSTPSGLSSGVATGVKVGAVVLSALVAAGVGIGAAVSLNGNGNPDSSDSAQTPPSGSTEQTPPETPETPETPVTPAPHEHVYGEWKIVLPSNCTEDGQKERSCDCGEKQTDVIPAAHKFAETASFDESGHWHECSVCGETDKVEGHIYGFSGECSVCDSILTFTQDLGFKLNPDGQSYSIISVGTVSDRKNIVIPAEHEGYPITKIEANAFGGNVNIETIAIPATVEVIGQGAFNGCTNLKSVTMYGQAQSARARRAVVAGNTIGDNAFAHCSSLEKVVLPQGLVSIGKQAFYGCSNLTELDIPDTVTEIGMFAFEVTGLKSLKLPKNLKVIRNGLFEGSRSLEEVILQEGLEEIEGYAFSGTSIKKVNIPSSVTVISEYAFYNTPTEVVFTVDAANTNYYVSGNCFIERATGTLLKACANPVIPSDGSIKKIASGAFVGNSTIGAVVIPSGVTEIGNGAFSDSSVTSVVIPEGITKLGTSMFEHCEQLTQLTLPSTITEIGYMTFGYCYALKTVNYNGTTAQFSSITKDRWWKVSASASNPVTFTLVDKNGNTSTIS